MWLIGPFLERRTNQQLNTFLDEQAPTWSSSAPLSSDLVNTATNLFSTYVNRIDYSILSIKRVLILFVIAALITALVNCGALGTVFIVRRQIRLGYTHFAGLRTVASIRLPEQAGPPSPVLGQAEEMGQVDFSVTPATPSLRHTAQLGGAPGGPSRRSSLIRPPSSSLSQSPHPSRPPSRARVRALAVQEDGGISRERAKNLQRLQRAEADLITTGVAMTLLSLCVAALGIWTIALIPKYGTVSWATYETALLGGTWIYSFINAVSIT